ncbi:twin-arginine translocation signal domain-containing protein [Halalkalicoccus tibetensis]|uniref:Twin-arginine translocation signal domain-containing protein n=1 Tax=Halalkalicoccus tibetensis TaxID=175632 RepID=A0ABD5V6X3_9EURY
MSDYNKTRRTFLKGAAATGVAATGITAFSGSAAADEPTVTVDGVEADESDVSIERGNPNAVIENLDIEFDEVDFDQDLDEDFDVDANDVTGTASGTVTGSALPNQNANENAAKDINTDFDDLEFIVTDVDAVGNPSQLVLLEIPDLFLDVLGLLVSLDLELSVEADPEGGLLGQLLEGLGRDGGLV